MDYSYIPQLYQQGVQQGLAQQFKLATEAQPIAQFMANLRQKRLDDLRDSQLELANRRADEAERHQRGVDLMNFSDKVAREMNPDNVEGYRAAAKYLGPEFSSIIPADKSIFHDIPAADYGADQGTFKGKDGQELPLTPGSTDRISFTELVKPKGSIYEQNEAKVKANVEARRYAQQVRVQIEEMKAKHRSRVQDWKEDPNNPQNMEREARANKLDGELEKIQEELDKGLIDAKVAKYRADAAHAEASALYAGSRQAYTEKATEQLGQPTERDKYLAGERARTAEIKTRPKTLPWVQPPSPTNPAQPPAGGVNGFGGLASSHTVNPSGVTPVPGTRGKNPRLPNATQGTDGNWYEKDSLGQLHKVG